MIRLLLALAVVGMIFYVVDRQMRSTHERTNSSFPDLELEQNETQNSDSSGGFYQHEINKARTVEQIMQQSSQRKLDE